MNNKRCEKICTLKRMEAVFNSRNELIRQQDGLHTIEDTKQSKELSKAYDNFEESYVDIILAESRYLQGLKENKNIENAKKLIKGDIKEAQELYKAYDKDIFNCKQRVKESEKKKKDLKEPITCRPIEIYIDMSKDIKEIDVEEITDQLAKQVRERIKEIEQLL
ncbi:hypothetical protein [Metaclostridioides mangenotii]|uniref:Vacuolar-type H+-ATPase subunit F/Vma7 n=1 Tax=Metaclostridioides mangenotii TaxID=1540 RepID=A0ABS4E9P2_9FIRM|nr:hypothetical protein [Clostridioides mangenotii]MBP1854660.1 vacuolar-type H+-ATPase subunit F/Vma7 [Clostridioides mangenotii]